MFPKSIDTGYMVQRKEAADESSSLLVDTIPTKPSFSSSRPVKLLALCLVACNPLLEGYSFSPMHKVLQRRNGFRPKASYFASNTDDNDDFFEAALPDSSREQAFSRESVESLTVAQLKQQLRLRGLKVSGRKKELVNRFLEYQQASSPFSTSSQMFGADDDENTDSKQSEARRFADKNGKALVDVTDYIEDEDQGKEMKEWNARVGDDDEEEEENTEPEVWGADARIIDDYEDGRVVVDCLSQSVVEFKGSNQTDVQAYVVASRDALKPFLAGGRNPQNATRTQTPAEIRLREIQERREAAARRPVRFEDGAGVDEGDETGLYKEALHRDFSDWGQYTTTGAQLSAAEVQGVLLLSDVYGCFTDDTKALAEKIAFECQPVVVMVPDLFRGEPWIGPTSGLNEKGQTYEEWRSCHSDLRVNVDVRAAAACLRERYGVSSVVVWGTCFGGGRALEAAAGWFPNKNIHDVDGKVGPPPVDPMACVAWYPIRYNLDDLFGDSHMGTNKTPEGRPRTMAVMGVFAGLDTIPGATPKDAANLKHALDSDSRVKDHMVKVFPDQEHGFAHRGLGNSPDEIDDFDRFVDDEFGGAGQLSLGDGDSEVACLLSTAFMETYSRVFLPTVGPPISKENDEADWTVDLEMNGRNTFHGRDVRQEIEEATNNFVEEPLGGYRIDPTDESQDGEMARLLRSMEGPDQKEGPYALEDEDDLATIYAKMKAHDENFQIF